MKNSSLEDLDHEIKKTLLESYYLREYYEIYFSDDDNIYLEKGIYNNIDITKMVIDARKKYKKAMKSASKNIKNNNYKEAARNIDEAITYIKKIDDLMSHNTKDGIVMYVTGFGLVTIIDLLEYFIVSFPTYAATGNPANAMIPVYVTAVKKYMDDVNFIFKKLMGAKKTTKYGVTGYADKSNYNIYKIRCREYLMKYIDDLKKLKNQLSSVKRVKEFNSNNSKKKIKVF